MPPLGFGAPTIHQSCLIRASWRYRKRCQTHYATPGGDPHRRHWQNIPECFAGGWRIWDNHKARRRWDDRYHVRPDRGHGR